MGEMFRSIPERFKDRYEVNVLSESPWVIIFDNFFTEREAKSIIKSVKQWERSTDTGLTNEFGETGRILSQSRTSSNAWCTAECEEVGVGSCSSGCRSGWGR